MFFGKPTQKFSAKMYYLHDPNRQKESTYRKYDEERSEADCLKLGIMKNVTMSRNTFISGMLGSVSFPVLTNLEEAKKYELGMLSSYCCVMAYTPDKAEQARTLQALWVT